MIIQVEKGSTRLQHSSGTEEALPLKTEEAATLPPYEQSSFPLEGTITSCAMGTPKKTLVVSVERGHTNCKECPYYEPSGVVPVFGGERKAKCRQIMAPYIFDCHEFDVRTIRILPSTPDGTPKKPRKPYRKDHKEIHALGWKPSKSSAVKRDKKLNIENS